MKSFGGRLKEARQARDITLDAIASATHIAPRYLDALERSDLEALPGGVFDKGYIRSYAQCLGIDPQPILEAYAVEERQRGRGTPESEQEMLQELSRLVEQRAKGKRGGRSFSFPAMPLAVAVIILGLLAAGGYWVLRGTAVDDNDPGTDVSKRIPLSGVPADTRRASVTADSGDSDAEAEARTAGPGALTSARSKAQKGPDEPGSAADPDRSLLAVTESGVGLGVVARTLIGEGDRFPVGTTVWFWTRVVRGGSGEVVRHVWVYEGRTIMNAELTIGGPHWRTYSTYTLPPGSEGSWAVEARSADGRVLAREEFLCLPPSD